MAFTLYELVAAEWQLMAGVALSIVFMIAGAVFLFGWLTSEPVTTDEMKGKPKTIADPTLAFRTTDNARLKKTMKKVVAIAKIAKGKKGDSAVDGDSAVAEDKEGDSAVDGDSAVAETPASEIVEDKEGDSAVDGDSTVAETPASKSEEIALKYMIARLSNYVESIKSLMSDDAVIRIKTPWLHSFTEYRGWDQIQKYFMEHWAKPGKNFKDWRHVDTESSGTGSDSITIVRWQGDVNKYTWFTLQSSISVNSNNKIVQIEITPSGRTGWM